MLCSCLSYFNPLNACVDWFLYEVNTGIKWVNLNYAKFLQNVIHVLYAIFLL